MKLPSTSFFFLSFSLLFNQAQLVEAQSEPQKQMKTGVVVADVSKETFSDSIEALGTLKARESLTLTTTVTEVISVVSFDDGMQVSEGDVIVEMTSAEEHALLSEAKAELSEARSQYERVQPLLESGAASASVVDERKKGLQTARARLKATQSRMSDRIITAPFSGVLGLRNVSVGTLVEPGDVITTLDDISIMKLDFSVPSTMLQAIRIGLSVRATAPGIVGRDFVGKVSSIGSRVDPATRSFTVRAILPNPDALLKPGLLMTVLLTGTPRETLVIPEEALVPKARKNFVFVVKEQASESIVEKREVQLGARKAGSVEILSGLTAGEKVITHGTIKVKDAQAVRITAEEKNNETLSELLEPQDGATQ